MRKKIFYGICMLGLVALVATSCKKKEGTTNSFGATHGAFQVVNIDDERAYIDPETYLTMWEDGDQFKVFNFENGRFAIFQVEEGAGGANQSHFVNQGEDIGYASGYYAFYPAEMVQSDFDGVYQKFVLDDIQYVHGIDSYTYALQNISIPQAAYTTYAENHYNFNIVFGVANFLVKCSPGTGGVTRYVEKIVVEDNHFNLCGEVTLKPNKIDATKLSQLMGYLKTSNDEMFAQKWSEYVISHEGDGLGYSAIGGGKVLTYDFTSMNGGKGIALNGMDARSLMIGLRPGAFAYGFTLKIYVRDGEDMKIIPIEKYNYENRLFVAEPGVLKTFNVGSITDLVNNY
jgi:hypothetical protein